MRLTLLCIAAALLLAACLASLPSLASGSLTRGGQALEAGVAGEAAAWAQHQAKPKATKAKEAKETAAPAKKEAKKKATKEKETKESKTKEKKTTEKKAKAAGSSTGPAGPKEKKTSKKGKSSSSSTGAAGPKEKSSKASSSSSALKVPTEAEFVKLFAEYKRLHKRKYKSAATEARAFGAFKNRHRAAVERNQRLHERRTAKAKAAGKPEPAPKAVFDPLLSPLGDVPDEDFKKRYLAGRPKRAGLPPVAIFKRGAAAPKAASKARFLQQRIQQLPDPRNFPVPGGDNVGRKRVGGDNVGRKRVGGEDVSNFEINKQNIEADLKAFRWKAANFGAFFGPMKGKARMEIDLSTVCFPATVRNQGDCRSCWAVTAVEHFQAVLAQTSIDGVLNGGMARLSAQQIVDCQMTADDQGCDGGTVVGAFDYIQKNGIVQSNAYAFPLDGTKHACTPVTSKEEIYAGAGQYRDWKVHKAQRSLFLVPPCLGAVCDPNPSAEQTLLDFWRNPPYRRASSGQPSAIPVVAYVDSSNWGDYKGGIFPASECSSAGADLIHIVQIVGYGTDIATGQPFWLIRNSWGAAWGEEGMIRLPFGKNACGLFNYVIYLEAVPTFLGANRQANQDLQRLSDMLNNSPRVKAGAARTAYPTQTPGSFAAPVGGATRASSMPPPNPFATAVKGGVLVDNRPKVSPFKP